MPNKNLKIKIVQSDIIWENKDMNFDFIKSQINVYDAGRVVVLPEMFSTGFTMNASLHSIKMESEFIEKLKILSTQFSCILTGSIIIEDQQKYYNRLIWILPNGEISYYDKRHLFSYAKENEIYTAGTDRVIVQVNGWRILLQICYDLRFPVFARNKNDYDAILYVANWPESRDYAWQQLCIARAIENQCYVIACNRVGKDELGLNYLGRSMIINPMGKIKNELLNNQGILENELSYEEINKIRDKFAFLDDRDNFEIY